MKSFSLFLFSIFIFHFPVYAQKEIVSTATGFIVAGKYSSADYYLDSVIKSNPKCVDALMMKGNVILNYSLDTTQTPSYFTTDDESVFSNTINEKPKVLSVKTVAAVEKIWQQCLSIDSTRTDIYKGLCSIYAMALMEDSLKNEIVRLTKVEKDDGEQAFRICEYARKFKERNKFDGAMELYQFVAQLFPKVAGVRCDMASEYFYKGKMNEALTWLDSCYNFKTVDETSFLNGAFIYSQLGYFDDAQNVLNTYSHIYNRKMDQFYYGLTLFSDSSAKYYEVLNEFCQTADSNAYANEDYIARKLLAFRNSFSLEQYKLLIADNNIPEYYKPLIYTRAVRQFADDCEPFLSYGIYESSIKNYPPAVQFLDEGENCQMDLTEKEYWMLNYAYALYMLGSTKKALLYFEPLTKSSNAFTQQAAKYFDAEILVAQKKNDAAKTLWQEIISSKVQTKYAVLAKQKLN